MPPKKAAQPSLQQLRKADRPRGHAGTSDTEQAIFAAMERLLERTPAHEISVAQVLEEAGISRATFYFYFSSKFAVLAGLLALVMEEINQVVGVWLQRAEGDDPKVALRASLRAAAT